MSNCPDVNFSSGKAIQTVPTTQIDTDGMISGQLLQYDMYSDVIPLTNCVASNGNTTKLVGFDFILDNQGTAVLPEDLSIYIFNVEPLQITTGDPLEGNSLFSTMDKTYFSSLVAKIDLTTIAIEASHAGILVGTATEDQISNYTKTLDSSTILYAVIVTNSAAPSDLETACTLTTRFKFEGTYS